MSALGTFVILRNQYAQAVVLGTKEEAQQRSLELLNQSVLDHPEWYAYPSEQKWDIHEVPLTVGKSVEGYALDVDRDTGVSAFKPEVPPASSHYGGGGGGASDGWAHGTSGKGSVEGVGGGGVGVGSGRFAVGAGPAVFHSFEEAVRSVDTEPVPSTAMKAAATLTGKGGMGTYVDPVTGVPYPGQEPSKEKP